MTSNIPPNPFKHTKRIVTGHNSDGKAIAIFEDELKGSPMAPGEEMMFGTRVWVTKESPANNSDNTTDAKDVTPARLNLIEPSGSHVTVVEVAPGGRSPVHRTSSIDYGVLVSGEITLILDDGVEHTITEPGSIIVQRGTIHQWVNHGSTWSKVVFVLIDAIPVQVKDGERSQVDLPQEFVGGDYDASKA